MANILSEEEAAAILRCDADDPNMLQLLPQVDAYIKNATGVDWAPEDDSYEEARPEAKAAARMLLVRWHEDPGGMASGSSALGVGFNAAIMQLKALVLELEEAAEEDSA